MQAGARIFTHIGADGEGRVDRLLVGWVGACLAHCGSRAAGALARGSSWGMHASSGGRLPRGVLAHTPA